MAVRLPRTLLSALGALAAILLLAACGSAKPSNSNASAERKNEQQFLNLAKCLREHGINVNTSTVGGPIRIQPQGRPSPQTMEAARTACSKYAPADAPKLSPQERVAREEAVQKFAKCMREHGIKVEAKTGNGGAEIAIGIRPGEGGPNPNSPGFEAAQKACQTLLPKPPGGFKALGGGPSTRSYGAAPGNGPKAGLQLGG
jgi:pyruvate/2-oxoglutarate dehydrogenase complex dihydrolipoamide acyltransferase (E2) component